MTYRQIDILYSLLKVSIRVDNVVQIFLLPQIRKFNSLNTTTEQSFMYGTKESIITSLAYNQPSLKFSPV